MPDQPLRPAGALDTFQDNELYDPAWSAPLAALQAELRPKASAIAAAFYQEAGEFDDDHLIGMLTEAELQHLLVQQAQSLLHLASPDLTAARHHDMALRIGTIHTMVGLTQKDLLRGQDILYTTLRSLVDADRHSQALTLLGRRLIRDITWQSEAYQQMQAARYDVLLNLSQLVWAAGNYTDLISQTAELLSRHPEIAACTFGKPNQDGIFQFEFIAGEPAVVMHLAGQPMPSLLEDEHHSQGLTGRAWHTKQIQHSRNIATDERLTRWRDYLDDVHLRSFVSIPICHGDQPPRSILMLYSPHVGGYASADQISFIRQIQSLLVFACARLESQAGSTDAVPYAIRQRWARLIRSDALQMHYQPILELKTGRIVKVEALVRLIDGARTIAPATFFPALSSDDFFEIYARGLDQALAQCTRWLASGLDFCVSVNLPSKALADPRYLHATRHALGRHGCPAERLVLEILETDALPREVDVAAALGNFKALGVGLAEDDLGSGHSSLTRLRQLPFDTIKIDRDIVSSAAQDPSQALRFIYQLTRLGHSLGKTVIVEGVEDLDMLEAIMVLGSDAVQGYVISRPMPAARLTEWLQQAQPPFPLPAPNAVASTLAKLAALLIWEERLHLMLDDRSAVTMGLVPSLPFEAESDLQYALADAALLHGLRSPQYQSARALLVASLPDSGDR